MSITSGIRSGLRSGIRSGLNPGTGTGTGDGPSGLIQAPTSAAGILALTGRDATHAYDCQEPSGSLLDKIGSMNLAPNATPLYQVSVGGWGRKFVGFNEGVNQRFSVGAGVGPNATLTPVAFFVIFTARTPGAMRNVTILSDAGATARSCMSCGATGNLRTQCGATTNDGVIDHRDSNAHAGLLTYDPGGTTNRYTDLEVDTGTFAAGVLDGNKGIGALTGLQSHLGEVGYLVILEGASAQFTTTQARTFLQNFGWSPPW